MGTAIEHTAPFPLAIMARSAQRKTGRKHRQPTMEVVDITIDELDRLIERIEKKALLNDDYDLLLVSFRQACGAREFAGAADRRRAGAVQSPVGDGAVSLEGAAGSSSRRPR